MVIFSKFILLFIPLLISFIFKGGDQREYIIHGYAQGTDYTVKYFAVDRSVSKQSVDSILSVIDSSMSLYKPYSMINRFNTAEEALDLDVHLTAVMRKSFTVYKATKGKFDVTVAPLVQAWGFGPKRVEHFPDSSEVKQLLQCVGMNNLRLNGSRLMKSKSCIQIDLNGIAQGYSVDVVAEHLTKKGISAYVVEIGGELRMKGPKPDGSAMRIGIEGPALSANAEPLIRHVIQINNGAITTAGNYRKYLQNGTKKLAHLIDPKSGYPLDNNLISVTLYAEDAITADGYDSPIMAMTVQEALDFVASKNGMEAYILYRKEDGSVADTLTKGFKKMIVDQLTVTQ